MSKLRGGVCDARCQQFHRECARKEEHLKTLWFLKNQQRLYDNLGGEKFSQKARALKKKKAAETKAPEETVKQQPLQSWRPKDEQFKMMRPMKPIVEDILYTPKVESFVSKNKYLRERYKDKPEDRYYFPYCSSWTFGWRLKDYPGSLPSKYAVCSVIQSSFYRRNASSLQRDPDWYRMCQTGDPNNFNEILTY